MLHVSASAVLDKAVLSNFLNVSNMAGLSGRYPCHSSCSAST